MDNVYDYYLVGERKERVDCCCFENVLNHQCRYCHRFLLDFTLRIYKRETEYKQLNSTDM